MYCKYLQYKFVNDIEISVTYIHNNMKILIINIK